MTTIITAAKNNVIGTGLSLGAVGEYGELYIIPSDEATESLEADVWSPMTNVNEGVSSPDIVLDGENGTITINEMGLYQVSVFTTHTLQGLEDAAILSGAVFVNGELLEKSIYQISFARGTLFAYNAGNTCLLDVTEVPTVLQVKCKLDISADMTMDAANFSIEGIYGNG